MTPDERDGGRQKGGENRPYTDWLRRRRQAYQRYASLLSDQLEAVKVGDVERVSALSDERDEVASLLEEQEDEELPPVPDDPDDETLSLASDVRNQLERCVELDADVQDRLEQLRDETLEAVRTARERKRETRVYIRADERDAPSTSSPYPDDSVPREEERSGGEEPTRHIDVQG